VPLLELIQAAAEVRQQAYAPYSKFLVGAALVLDGSGEIFVGCNVENASFGLTICAERMAVGAAVARYDLRQFPPTQMVVIAHPLAAPCGACRQFLAEFSLELEVVCVDAFDHQRRQNYKISELLPNNFRL